MTSSILRFSEAANLAMHAMVYLAWRDASGPCPAADIASGLQISENHLAKVLQRLVHGGMVHSIRGARGGFSLAKPPEQVTLLSILELIDGPLPEHHCLLGNETCFLPSCMLSGVEAEARDLLVARLGKMTLRDMTR